MLSIISVILEYTTGPVVLIGLKRHDLKGHSYEIDFKNVDEN
jgi:hypothetical protein